MSGNLIVKDSCIECKHVSEKIEFGYCDCDTNDYSKGEKSQAEISWLRRHGKLSEIKKPLSYTIASVEQPLENVISAMQRLSDESARLHGITKSLSDDLQRKNRKRKLRYTKLKLEVSVSKRLEKSKTQLEKGKNEVLKKSDNFVVLGALNGMKGVEITGWIEKKLVDGN